MFYLSSFCVQIQKFQINSDFFARLVYFPTGNQILDHAGEEEVMSGEYQTGMSMVLT
jgi:hypothetical protein